MRIAAISLWVLQVVVSLVALIAALANFESVVVTGPTLAAAGLLLGAVTNRIGSPLVLAHALFGPLVCCIGAFLIAANHWGPQEARGPIMAIIVIYLALNVPLSIGALQRIRQMPNAALRIRQIKWQFSLKSMLVVMTAVCILITAGQLLVHYLPDYPWRRLFDSYWPGFGGVAFVTLLLMAVVYRRFRATSRVNHD